MMWWEAFVHWLHLMAAVVWLGGMIFTSLVLQPVMRRALGPEVRMPLYKDIGARFKAVQVLCLVLLLATGVQKLWGLWAVPEVFHSPFGAVLGLKLGLAGAVTVLSVLHSYVWGPRLVELASSARSAEYRAVMGRLVFWGRVNLALSLLIVFCAALLRFNPF